MPSHTPTPPTAARQHSALVIVIGLAAFFIVLAGLRAASDIVGLVALAGCLVIAVDPMRGALVRRGTPRWLATTLLVLFLYVLIIGFFSVLVLAGAQLAATLPSYEPEFMNLYNSVLDFLGRHGVSNAELADQAGKAFSVDTVLGVVRTAIGGVGGVLSALLLLIFLIAFIAGDTADIRSRTSAVLRHRPLMAAALGRFAVSTRKQWMVGAVFGLAVAALDYGALLVLGVPMALTWALLSFITNFIPNIGFFLGLVPPALMALLDGGWKTALWVIVLYTLFNNGLQSTVQPKVIGDAVGLNTTMSFVSVIGWTLVLGPLGAVLSIPLTLLVKAVLIDSDPTMEWANAYLEAPHDSTPNRDTSAHPAD